MKHFIVFLGAFVLFVAASSEIFSQPPQIDFMKLMRSPMMQRTQRAGAQAAVRAMWNGNAGNLAVLQLVDEPEIREAWGISDEQHAQIKAIPTNQALLMKHPDFLATAGELGKYVKPDDIYMENATQEQLDGFAAAQGKLVGLVMEILPTEIGNALNEEQNQKMLEFQLASMSENPFVMPDSFQALGLSDEQKKQMDEIKKEFEADFMTLMDGVMEMQFERFDKIFDQFEKDGMEIKDPKAFQEKIMEAAKQLESQGKTDENMRRQNEEIQKKGQAFTARVKIKIYDILTDEQMAKLEKLVDNPPEYVTNFMKKMKEKQGLSLDAQSPADFMNAWKPGEPIPEEYRQKRVKKAFPQAE